jgi:hypothetical protein
MNALDAAIVAVVVVSGLAGWRFGLAARAFAWAGVTLAVVIGLPYLPRIVTDFGGTRHDDRMTVAVIYLAVLAVVGQAAGLGLGVLVHALRDRGPGLSRWNRGAGAAIGVAGVVLVVWLLPPSVAFTDSWLSRATDGSTFVSFVDAHAPDAPSAGVGRLIATAPYPSVTDTTDRESPTASIPDRAPVTLKHEVAERVRRSVVKVEADGCPIDYTGSGFVAARNIVVTTAHVVAGSEWPWVWSGGQGWLDATVVVFDPGRDLAVLFVPGLEAPALALGDARSGESSALFGYPAGGSLQAAAAHVLGSRDTRVRGIYGAWDSRDVISIRARLEPGDSGGPLVDEAGYVVGVVFARSGGVGYVIPSPDVRAVLDAPHSDVRSACIP